MHEEECLSHLKCKVIILYVHDTSLFCAFEYFRANCLQFRCDRKPRQFLPVLCEDFDDARFNDSYGIRREFLRSRESRQRYGGKCKKNDCSSHTTHCIKTVINYIRSGAGTACPKKFERMAFDRSKVTRFTFCLLVESIVCCNVHILDCTASGTDHMMMVCAMREFETVFARF